MAGYDWHDEKNKENSKKHKIAFEKAVSVFSDPFLWVERGQSENYEEDRFTALGRSQAGKDLFFVVCERKIWEDEIVWIISVRKQTPREKLRLEGLRLRQSPGADTRTASYI